MTVIHFVEFCVPTRVEFDGEERRHHPRRGGEEPEILAVNGARWRSGVGEDEGEAEAGAGGDLGQNRKDKLSGERGRDVGGIGGLERDSERVKGAAD